MQIPVHLTAFYTALSLLWLLVLAGRVMALRWKHQVGIHSGGHDDLDRAIRAHANAAEYLPGGLLLILVLELLAAPLWVLHTLGLALVIGRVAHAIGLWRSSGVSLGRQVGMLLTLLVYAVGALLLLAEAFIL
ncbi:MAPEG family protein [Rhodovibrio salinarum]|nr:MAPEG family protein [Rhodovibrio salinarum]